jgi:hypothetical protein
MSIEEQLIDLVDQTVQLFGFTPDKEYNSDKPMEVKQGYHYVVDWIEFTSEDVVRVHNGTIFFTQEMTETLVSCLMIKYPERLLYGQEQDPVDMTDWLYYRENFRPPPDPYEPL